MALETAILSLKGGKRALHEAVKALKSENGNWEDWEESWTSHHSQGKSALLPNKTKSEKRRIILNICEFSWIRMSDFI